MDNQQDNKIEETLKKCEAEREEYLNGWKRAKADFINYQKDETKRFEEIVKFSNEDLVRELIAVLDSFGLAEKHSSSDPSPIRVQLEDMLKKRGLEKITVSAGQQFNPAIHESIGEAESDKPAGTIAEEVESGYLLNGKVIRPARVKLARENS